MSEIKIQCPDCSESFLVPEEFIGNPVECGSCQCHFEITEEVIDRLSMKRFPGEKEANLEVFSKRAPQQNPETQVSFATAAYDQHVDPNAVLPIGPRHLLAIFSGISLIAAVILFFVLGNGEQGVMNDVTNDKRWVLAGFSALLGGLLIIFGCRKYKVAGAALAVILAASVCSMPLIYSEKPLVLADIEESIELDIEAAEPIENIVQYKIDLGYAKVENKIAEAEHPDRVLAIALMRSKPVHLELIKDYLASVLVTAEIPRVYQNRNIGGVPVTLLVYLNTRIPAESAADYMDKFGKVVKVRPELKVIEVLVNGDALVASDTDVLLDESHPDFYSYNLGELKSIDRNRQLTAIQRLENVKEVSLRSDIVTQMLRLFADPHYPHRVEVVETLNRWSVPNDGCSIFIGGHARELMDEQAEIPACYLTFLVDHDVSSIGDILTYAWQQDQLVHENTLIKAGKRGELALIEVMPTLEPYQLDSAVTVLRKIGTAEAIPSLLVAYELAVGDLKKSIKATIDEIKSRE